MEAAVQNVVNELKASRDEEPIKSIQKYLTNNNYRSLVAFSLIFMFSLVFYLIYLLVDAFIDKEKHYELCVKSFERYEKRCRAKKAKQQEQQPNDLERLDDQQIKQHIGNLLLVFCPPDAIFSQYKLLLFRLKITVLIIFHSYVMSIALNFLLILISNSLSLSYRDN